MQPGRGPTIAKPGRRGNRGTAGTRPWIRCREDQAKNGVAMTMRVRAWGRALGIGLLVVSAAISSGPDASAALPVIPLPHITLEKSEPADGSKVGPVSEIRLFFSGAPLMRGASVRVVTSARQLMRSSPPAPDP